MLRIGIAPGYHHGDLHKEIYNGRPFLYTEVSFFRFILKRKAMCYMLPAPGSEFPGPEQVLSGLDGLILQGGDDVAPESYHESPLQPEWAGDPLRDSWELPLAAHAIREKIPLLGICRGMQVINVCLGGSLWQDIEKMVPGSLRHKIAGVYDKNQHELKILPGGLFASWYPKNKGYRVNSIHHQAIKQLATGLRVEAISAADQIIEAVGPGSGPQAPEGFCIGVQWHPEFQSDGDRLLLPADGYLGAFLEAAHRFRIQRCS